MMNINKQRAIINQILPNIKSISSDSSVIEDFVTKQDYDIVKHVINKYQNSKYIDKITTWYQPKTDRYAITIYLPDNNDYESVETLCI